MEVRHRGRSKDDDVRGITVRGSREEVDCHGKIIWCVVATRISDI